MKVMLASLLFLAPVVALGQPFTFGNAPVVVKIPDCPQLPPATCDLGPTTIVLGKKTVLVFGAGIYNVQQIQFQASTTDISTIGQAIYGQGIQKTILRSRSYDRDVISDTCTQLNAAAGCAGGIAQPNSFGVWQPKIGHLTIDGCRDCAGIPGVPTPARLDTSPGTMASPLWSNRQSTMNGIRWYAEGENIESVKIWATRGDGYVSLAGNATGVDDNLAESAIKQLQITQCNGHGWFNQGPQDTLAMHVVLYFNGGWGYTDVLGGTSGNSLAAADLPAVIYGNGVHGDHWDTFNNSLGQIRAIGGGFDLNGVLASGGTNIDDDLVLMGGSFNLLGNVNIGSEGLRLGTCLRFVSNNFNSAISYNRVWGMLHGCNIGMKLDSVPTSTGTFYSTFNLSCDNINHCLVYGAGASNRFELVDQTANSTDKVFGHQNGEAGTLGWTLWTAGQAITAGSYRQTTTGDLFYYPGPCTTAGSAISAANAVGTSYTLTVPTGHGIVATNSIVVNGVGVAAYNSVPGTPWTVTSVTPTTIVYTGTVNGPAASSGGFVGIQPLRNTTGLCSTDGTCTGGSYQLVGTQPACNASLAAAQGIIYQYNATAVGFSPACTSDTTNIRATGLATDINAVGVCTQGGMLQVTPTGVTLGSSTFAALPTAPPNGTMIYCSNCTIANPCAAAGTGALAKRLNGLWVCN